MEKLFQDTKYNDDILDGKFKYFHLLRLNQK